MAAQPVPHPSTDKKRVKVYELRNNDWFDRGTGFCTAAFHINDDGQREPRVMVESEDQPDRILLETRIGKEDGFHKQQETLIVWTEPQTGIDMALSFQEAEGCTLIWRFINGIMQQYQSLNGPGDDSLSDDFGMDTTFSVSLPPANLANLGEMEAQIRMMSNNTGSREALTKFVLTEDYIGKLIPLVGDAEDLESLNDLHRLCNIMKMIILLNDTSIIEHAVSDECVMGVVGALEYDPDFPSHKANHRLWLQDASRYKEVVRIEDGQILRKVHQTYRLQYLKDVVLARILDDNTFSVLNSLIFFNQVDIVQHLQANASFLGALFDIFARQGEEPKRKKEAVLFIQQCCAIAKNLQPPARQTLYNNFISHGLLDVINFGLRHADVAVRVGATDILVSMIDHDPQMIRNMIYRQSAEHRPPLTDSLIDLLLVEVDLGVKSQISDALKVLLDSGPTLAAAEAFAKANGGEYAARLQGRLPMPENSEQTNLISAFYHGGSAEKLFQPLMDLKGRTNMHFTVQEASIYTYLVEILNFFIRQHGIRARQFVRSRDLVKRISQLLACPEKFLKLVAIRFIRQLIGHSDEFFVTHVIHEKVVGPILDVLNETMPRDNLLSSACLEFFEFTRKESLKDLIKHVVENYREQLQKLSSMELFRDLIDRYDQTRGFTVNLDYFIEAEDDVGRKRTNVNPRTGLTETMTMDQAEEEYWNTSDDEEELSRDRDRNAAPNGSSPSTKLVDYASDEEADENTNAGTSSVKEENQAAESDLNGEAIRSRERESSPAAAPPERLSEKRRREEDEEDNLDKLMQHKRRNSTSASSNAATTSNAFRRKRSLSTQRDAGGGHKKIAISISPSIKAGSGNTGGRSDDDT